MLRECVVVATGDTFYKSELRAQKERDARKTTDQPAPPVQSLAPAPKPELPPLQETPEGEKINLVLGFEPIDIKHLSESSFDAFIVNDSNYELFLTISTRSSDSDLWTLRYAGIIEAAIQEFVFELQQADLPALDRISVSAIPFKRSSPFALKEAFAFEQRIDSTKFARLHCFVQSPYFDTKVLPIDIIRDDRVVKPLKINPQQIQEAIADKKQAEQPRKRISKSSKTPAHVVEVDLHASALLDNLNGLSKADILNYQIDTFRRVMDENLSHPGRKIVFIHGKGEGVLRQALMKELSHRYKGHDVADASFREYGFGATQVTIRQIKK